MRHRALNFRAKEWARFDGYELRDGYTRPKCGGRLERFSPWDEYEETTQSRPAPYVELFNLVKPGPAAGLADPTGTELVKWCRRFGLLGLALQQFEMILLRPVKAHGVLRQYGHVRRGDRWLTFEGAPEAKAHVLTRAEPWPYALPPVVRGPIRWLGEFFPSVPQREQADYQYPCPGTDRFWRLYCEPVAAFTSAVVKLRDAVVGLKDHNERQRWPNDPASALHDVLSTISFTVIRRGNTFEQVWVFPSLLSSLTMMAVTDVISGKRLSVCENPMCSRYFADASYQTRYCSKTCGWTEQKRRYRQRRSLRAER
jgi:predicted RNA-binding Zn ribbon-like protein